VADDEVTPSGLAGHLQTALVGAHAKVADKINEHKRAHVASVLDQFEADLAPLIAAHVQTVLDNPGTPDHLKDLLRETGAPEHFSGSLLIGVAVGAIIGPVLGSALEPITQNIANEAWNLHPSRPLSPDVLTAATLKGVLTEDAAANGARQSGISPDRFHTMFEASGNAIGFDQALLLERRGQLVGETLESTLQYSNVNPRFYAAALNLIYDSPGVGAVIAARVKNRLSEAEALRLYKEAGGNPANFDWETKTGGRPLGIETMADLVNRGQATDADLAQAASQSDLALDFQKFVPFLKEYWPPVRSIIPMLRAGAADEATVRRYWDAAGVPTVLQDIYVKEAAHTTTNGVKELSQAQVVAEYEAKTIDAPTATAQIVTLGYSAADAGKLIALADAKKEQARRDAVVRMIGTRYVAHKITVQEAATLMGEVPVDAARQAELVKLWDIERQASIHFPTAAQIVGAYRRALITPAQCKNRLLAAGVATADLPIVVGDGWPPTKPAAAAAAVNAVVNA
jgi:hypothetical protein